MKSFEVRNWKTWVPRLSSLSSIQSIHKRQITKQIKSWPSWWELSLFFAGKKTVLRRLNNFAEAEMINLTLTDWRQKIFHDWSNFRQLDDSVFWIGAKNYANYDQSDRTFFSLCKFSDQIVYLLMPVSRSSNYVFNECTKWL